MFYDAILYAILFVVIALIAAALGTAVAELSADIDYTAAGVAVIVCERCVSAA